MRRTTFTVLAVTVAIVIGACGSSKPQPNIAKTDPFTTSTQSVPVVLEGAVREAITKNHALLGNVLWTNRIPANPPATAGPALAFLRRSVAERKKQRVRVRVLSDHFRVLSLHLEPTYTSATATVLDAQRVQPTHLNGRPIGKPSSISEHVRLELRRVANTNSFVVWKTTLLK